MRGPAILTLVTVLAGLSAAELAARRYFAAFPNRLHRVESLLAASDPFFRRIDGERGAEWEVVRPHTAKKRVPAERAADEKLVILVGESVADDFDVSTLAAALKAHGYAARPIAVNAGLGGYTTAAVRASARQALRARPDLFVVMVGNNRTGAEPGPLVRALARRSRAAAMYAEWRVSEKGGVRAFESNVRALVKAAVASGSAVVVCTLPVNDDSPPNGVLPFRDPAFREGWRAFHDGRFADALKSWQSFEGDPSVRYWRAKAERRLGRAEPPRPEKGGARAGYGPERRAALLKVASEEGVLTADLEKAFEKAHASPDAFVDDVHWRRSWDALAAETIAAAVAPPARKIAAPSRRLSSEEAEALADEAVTLATHQEAVSERVLPMFGRLWRESPEVLRERLKGPHAARGRPFGSGQLSHTGPIDETRWALALASAGEALWRQGRRAEGDALLAQAARDPKFGGFALGLLAIHDGTSP